MISIIFHTFQDFYCQEKNEGDMVEVLVVRTARGLFAKNLSLKEAHPTKETKINLNHPDK